MTRWGKEVNDLRERYTTEYVIAQKDTEIFLLIHPSNITPYQYGKALWNKALRRNLV